MDYFVKLSKRLMAATELTPASKLVYVTLADLARIDKHLQPRIEKLSESTALADKTVRRALAELRACGLVTTERQQHGLTYQIHPVHILWKTPTPPVETAPSRAAKMTDLRGHNDRSHPIKENLLKRTPPNGGAARRASSTSAPRRKRKTTPQPSAEKPKRKPPAHETASAASMNGTDFWPHDSTKVAEVRGSLQRLAVSLHFPPPDDAIVRQVLDACRGANAAAIEHRIRDLYYARRFDQMRSWGLVPVLLKPWFGSRSA